MAICLVCTFLVFLIPSLCDSVPADSARQGRKNVLFISVDDLRPEIGAYYDTNSTQQMFPGMYTPNIDRLASQSLVLKRSYVQQAVCTPSRASALTGRRPDTTHVYTLAQYFREKGGDFTTIPQYFKQHGYATAGMGKIFHAGNDDPVSWTVPYFKHKSDKIWKSRDRSWRAVPLMDHLIFPLPDEKTATQAIRTLRELGPAARSGQQNLFLGVGFSKPHLPFTVPEEYFDLYPTEDISLPSNPYGPRDMPGIAWASWVELRKYKDIAALRLTGAVNNTLPDQTTRQLRRAYYAAVSYIDALIGDVLRELENQDLVNDTVVVFWSDHGYSLGEQGRWCKHTNFELSTWAPMMLRVPGLTDGGRVSEELTELVDLFPTLAEAAGLPEVPLCPLQDSCNVSTCTEGSSLVPLMLSGAEGSVAWKDVAFSQYPRNRQRVMGYSLRTRQYRYTQWVRFDASTYTPNWTRVYGTELYDYENDPEGNVNVAREASYAAIRRELGIKLRQGWRAALPN